MKVNSVFRSLHNSSITEGNGNGKITGTSDDDTFASTIEDTEEGEENVLELCKESSIVSLSDADDDDSAIMRLSLIQKTIGKSTSSLTMDKDDRPPLQNKAKKVSFTGINSFDSIDDAEKTYEQVVEKLGKMKAKLEQAKVDLSAEKAIRRKKEKSLVKLAKELTKRAKKDNEKDENIETLRNAMATLQSKLKASQSEMDDRITASEKKSKEYNELLDQAHEKYRSTVSDHDTKISKMSKEHSLEVGTIRQSSREVAIECERLRSQIGQIRKENELKLAENRRSLESVESLLKDATKKHSEVVAKHERTIAEINERNAEEMNDRILASEKKTREYNELIDQAHEKHRSTVSEHDAKISQMNKQHSFEIETIRQSSREIEFECERLRSQIGQLRKEYELEITENNKALKSIENTLQDAERKYSNAVAKHEKRITEMNESHAKQIDNLREQLLTANLMTDKLRTELASLQIKESPDKADEIVYQTLTSAQLKKDETQSNVISKVILFMSYISFIAIIFYFFTHTLGLDPMNSLCSPVKPETTITPGKVYKAPWWAPEDHKELAFSFCGERPRTSLSFKDGKLFVFDGDSSEVLLKRRSHEITVNSNSFLFSNKKGKRSSLKTPWSK